MAVPPAPQAPIGSGKSLAAIGAGALTTIITGALDSYVLPHPLTPELVAAIQTVVTLAAVYFTPHNLVGGR